MGPTVFWQALSDHESARNILESVTLDFISCRAIGMISVQISINVSGTELSNTDFAKTLLATLAKAGIEGPMIEIEVTDMRQRSSAKALRR